MTATLFNRYIWLVETIYSAGHISMEEINRRWANSQYNELREKELPLRTFHRHKEAIKAIFDIEIKCDRRIGNLYYIANTEDLEEESMRRWLISTFSVNSLLSESRALKQRILFEEIPSGQRYLTQIIEAMRDSRTLELTYQSFWNDTARTVEVAPYCVKVFHLRWYVVARSLDDNNIRIYALDRIHALRTTEHPLVMTDGFDPKSYFAESFGVIVDVHCAVQRVRIRVQGVQRQYMRTLPLHASQREIESSEKSSVFEFYLRPTLDFQQELLTHAVNAEGDIEVLEPR